MDDYFLNLQYQWALERGMNKQAHHGLIDHFLPWHTEDDGFMCSDICHYPSAGNQEIRDQNEESNFGAGGLCRLHLWNVLVSVCVIGGLCSKNLSVCTAVWSKPVAAQDKELLEWKCHGLATSHSIPLVVFSVCQDYWMNKLGHRHITCCSCRYEIHSQESMESCICLLYTWTQLEVTKH